MRLLIGLFLIIIVSPALVWMSASQNRADDFSALKQVNEEEIQSGEVIVHGASTLVDELTCPGMEEGSCVYIKTQSQTYSRSEFVACGEIDEEKVTIIGVAEDRCDSDGVCETCSLVESYDWIQSETDEAVPAEQFASFMIGSYEVQPSDKTVFIGVEQFEESTVLDEEPVEGDILLIYEYLPLNEMMLAAGYSNNGIIDEAPEGGAFTVSSKDYDQTLASLETSDKNARYGALFTSLALMMLGFIVLTSQVTGPLAGTFKIIPGLGGAMAKGSKFAVAVLSALIGLVVWIAIFLPLSFIPLG